MEDSQPRKNAQNRADLLVRVGMALFATGLAATAIIIIPFFFGVTERPTWLNAIAAGGLTVGLAVALLAIVVMIRAPTSDDGTNGETDETDEGNLGPGLVPNL